MNGGYLGTYDSLLKLYFLSGDVECEILLIKKHIIQYSYYDNETAGDQFITFMASQKTINY